MKLFECIIDDGKSVFKTFTAAKSKKALLDECSGNGSFEKIKDVTNLYFSDTTLDKLNEDLFRMGWGEGERKIICALVQQHIDGLKR